MTLAKIWHERLFRLHRSAAEHKEARVNVTYVPITPENAAWVRDLRGAEYVSQFEAQLKDGDFGFYAMLDDSPVGYGWAKHAGADDFFFRIDRSCVYLCRFFVQKAMRGNNIYPALISALIERESDCDCFYIAVERGNIASERGLSKIGFTLVKEFKFIRAFKVTLNKKRLIPF